MSEFHEDHGPCDICDRTLVIRLTNRIYRRRQWLCSECVGKLPQGSYHHVRRDT